VTTTVVFERLRSRVRHRPVLRDRSGWRTARPGRRRAQGSPTWAFEGGGQALPGGPGNEG